MIAAEGAARADALDVFADGTPEAPGAARAVADAAIASGRPLRWHVDPGNLGLLSRAAAARPRAITAVLAAVDVADDETHVAHEGALVPTLRRLRDAGVALALSTGRPYVLPPPALDLSTNDLCGLACNMCGNRATERDPHTIAPEDLRALIDDAAAWGIRRVALTGAGEPFRDRHLLGHLAHANARGLVVTITSNGFPISEAIAATLAAAVASVSISIHGATDEMHEQITGVAKAGDNAWRAIARLVRARDAHPGSKLSVNVSAVIQRANLAEMPALIRRARAAGVNGVNLQPINLQHGSFRGEAIVRRDDVAALATLWPRRADADALDAVFAELEAERAASGKLVHASAERLALIRRYFADSSRDALGVACRVGEAFLAVDHRGAIRPCYRLPWTHGDARRVKLPALWNSQAYARTRRQVDACPLTCLNNCFFRTQVST